MESPACSMEQFLKVMALIQAGTQRTATAETIKAYYWMLKDLSFEQLLRAAQLALAEHEFSTLPTIAMLRRLATEKATTGTTAQEALEAARRAINQAGGSYASSDDRKAALARLEAPVAHCLQTFGWDRICDSANPEALQAQWRKQWEDARDRDSENQIRPARLRNAIPAGQGRIVDTSGFARIDG